MRKSKVWDEKYFFTASYSNYSKAGAGQFTSNYSNGWRTLFPTTLGSTTVASATCARWWGRRLCGIRRAGWRCGQGSACCASFVVAVVVNEVEGISRKLVRAFYNNGDF